MILDTYSLKRRKKNTLQDIMDRLDRDGSVVFTTRQKYWGILLLDEILSSMKKVKFSMSQPGNRTWEVMIRKLY